MGLDLNIQNKFSIGSTSNSQHKFWNIIQFESSMNFKGFQILREKFGKFTKILSQHIHCTRHIIQTKLVQDFIQASLVQSETRLQHCSYYSNTRGVTDMVHSVTIVLESLSHPQKFCTTTTGGDILHFDHG
jgi:hypothetical protein